MRDALKSYLALAGGVTEVTRQRALDAAKALAASGEAAAEQVTALAEDLLTQTRQNREAVVALVGFEVDRALGRVGLASADEVTSLTERVRELEARLAALSGSTASAQKASGDRAPAQKASKDEASGDQAAGSRAAGDEAATGSQAPAKKKAPAKKAPAKKKAGGA